ncbi:MAG: GntR family transcriptional regulator, partial [Verrucomicrobiales bacterium]
MPAPLTLDALSRHYEVSSTPVRAAVAALTDGGLLTKKANGRLAPADWSPPTTTAEPIPKARLPLSPPDPSKRISFDLVTLSLEGEPLHLREEVTAEKYGLSRSAVRNILHRLAGQGLLEHIPRRGWRLRPFRQEDLRSFIEVREVLELKALDLARPRLVEADLRAILDGNLEPADEGEPPLIDNSLHAYIIGKAENHYLRDFFNRHGHYYDILFEWEDLDRSTAIETVRQHRDILTPMLEKDWRSAAKALSHHIRENHPILSRFRKPSYQGS